MSFIPLPRSKRRFVNEHCDECHGLCRGCYLKVDELWEHVFSCEVEAQPPSDVILREFNQRHAVHDDRRLLEIANEVLSFVATRNPNVVSTLTKYS